jgi:hypothetical protein
MIFNLPDLILGLGFAVFSGIYFAGRLLRRGGLVRRAYLHDTLTVERLESAKAPLLLFETFRVTALIAVRMAKEELSRL